AEPAPRQTDRNCPAIGDVLVSRDDRNMPGADRRRARRERSHHGPARDRPDHLAPKRRFEPSNPPTGDKEPIGSVESCIACAYIPVQTVYVLLLESIIRSAYKRQPSRLIIPKFEIHGIPRAAQTSGM